MAQSMNKAFRTTVGQRVTFELEVGEGQIGSSLITLPGRKPLRRRDSFELDLGLGENLAGKKLLCTTIVTDVREETNNTFVEANVSDGVSEVRDSREEAAAEENGMVTYGIVVRFR
jgi:hypothetical protein